MHSPADSRHSDCFWLAEEEEEKEKVQCTKSEDINQDEPGYDDDAVREKSQQVIFRLVAPFPFLLIASSRPKNITAALSFVPQRRLKTGGGGS